MWVFYYDMPEAAYYEPSDVAVFVLVYFTVAACVLIPSFFEKRRNES